jgi:hypothetical protein
MDILLHIAKKSILVHPHGASTTILGCGRPSDQVHLVHLGRPFFPASYKRASAVKTLAAITSLPFSSYSLAPPITGDWARQVSRFYSISILWSSLSIFWSSFVEIEPVLEYVIFKLGGILESNYGRQVCWERSSWTDIGRTWRLNLLIFRVKICQSLFFANNVHD